MWRITREPFLQSPLLLDGTYTVKADVIDLAGNPAVEATRTVVLDRTPPSIAFATPAAPSSTQAMRNGPDQALMRCETYRAGAASSR